MTTLIENQKVKKLKKYIFNPIIVHQSFENFDVLRIENSDEFTRIDFIYYASSYYVNGGWVQMSKDTFIRPEGTEIQMKLASAINIPIAPKKHYFRSVKDLLCYTLYFPPLPKGVKKIDIIECETSGGNWFNFYGVSMEKIGRERILVRN